MYRHSHLIKLGLNTNAVYATKLISLYLSSGLANSVSHAHQVFDEVPVKDLPLWTSLISAYARHNQPHTSLHLFFLMLRQTKPDSDAWRNDFLITAVARAIASAPQHLLFGHVLHACIIKAGIFPFQVIVGTSFVDMYSKCGAVESARKLFEDMYKNHVTWNAMLSGYMQNSMESHGLMLFYQMKCGEFIAPDEYSISTVLSGCAHVQDLVSGMQVHGYAIRGGFEVSCANSIANMYFSCGRIACAKIIVDVVHKDTISKLLSIRGYILNHNYVDAFRYLCSLDNIVEILKTDYTIFVPLFTLCTKLSLVRVGKQVHGLFIALVNSSKIIKSLDEDGAIIGCTLIEMYCKSGDVAEGKKVFETWPWEQHVSLLNTLVSGYIHNGLIEAASVLFGAMPKKDVVSWTSMMTGFVQNDMPLEGLSLLSKMYCSSEGGYGVDGNCLTFVVSLEACTRLTDLERGKQIHTKIIRRSPGSVASNNVVVGTALVEMYSRSGSLRYAERVFDSMEQKNVVAWTSILTGFAAHGYGFQALEMFQKMLDNGIKPNAVTFVAVLTACSHCGLVDEGLKCFKEMKKYGLVPEEDHYTCLIDMLGRHGRLEDAWLLVNGIQGQSDRVSSDAIWAALLSACQLYGNVEIGRKVAPKILKNRKQNSRTRIALSNVYAAAGMWNEAYGTRTSLQIREGDADRETAISRVCVPPLPSGQFFNITHNMSSAWFHSIQFISSRSRRFRAFHQHHFQSSATSLTTLRSAASPCLPGSGIITGCRLSFKSSAWFHKHGFHTEKFQVAVVAGNPLVHFSYQNGVNLAGTAAEQQQYSNNKHQQHQDHHSVGSQF